MANLTYKTIPEELMECADAVAVYFDDLGYTIKVEESDLGFPFTPALVIKRQRTKGIVEVVSEIPLDKVSEWASYGRSYGQDFRVFVCQFSEVGIAPEVTTQLREIGVGLLVFDGDRIREHLPPIDLAINIELPSLNKYPKPHRRALGPAYEQFTNGLWREGFETACQAFEDEARRYLKRHVRSGRVLLVTKNGLITPKIREINRQTMGQLAGTFSIIYSANRADSQIGKLLAAINQDRIGVAHKKTQKWTERRLRENVGRHMWMLCEGIKYCFG